MTEVGSWSGQGDDRIEPANRPLPTIPGKTLLRDWPLCSGNERAKNLPE